MPNPSRRLNQGLMAAISGTMVMEDVSASITLYTRKNCQMWVINPISTILLPNSIPPAMSSLRAPSISPSRPLKGEVSEPTR